MDERIYQIALSILNKLGPIKARILLDEIGSIEGVFKEKASAILKIGGIGRDVLSGLNRDAALIRAEEELLFIEDSNIQLYYFKDPNFPKQLKECVDSPLVLFTLGNVNFNQRNISIVGMRKSTSYGKKMVDELVADLAPMNVQVVSGLAHGIDKAAHEAAIHNDISTLGVLGHGLDTMYPAAHRPLAKRMLENGGLVTEYISRTPGDPGNFPKRNRIVAGLSEATVVVESSESGGSLITANLAFDYNREVFAFPGNADRISSAGCNNLIRRTKAHLITSAEDLTSVLGWDHIEKPLENHAKLFEDLSETETKVVTVFQELGELDVDDLAIKLQLSSSDLSVQLFNLEMKGVIKTLPGKRYAMV